MEEAKKKFEKEREKILSEIPTSIKDMFGQIGFTAAEPNDDSDQDDDGHSLPEIIPILILSPYDVPPKPVRDVYWFDMFAKNKRTKKLEELPHLVFHYGADDPDDCYSFIEHEDFIHYETGRERGFDNLPDHIAQKVSQGVELTEEEQIRVRGLKEMKEDLEKEPLDRKRGNAGFKERHEMLVAKKKSSKEPAAKRQKK